MAIAPSELTPAVPPATTPSRPKTNRTFAARLWRHSLARLGLIIVALLVFVALFAPFISSIDPLQPIKGGLGPLGEPHRPGDGFLLGADTIGRDVWTRTLYGTQISLLVGFFAMLTAVTIGTVIGLVSGYFGGWVDSVLMRITEIVLSLPTVLLAIALAAVLPTDPAKLPWLLQVLWKGFTLVLPQQLEQLRLFNLLFAIGLVTWTGIARAVRGQVLSLKQQEYIEAARAVGCSNLTILFRHLLPNVGPTVIVLATLATANNILLEAGLSFLGLGVDPSTPSWGGTIAQGQPFMLSAPWIIVVPGIAVVLAVAGFNLLGQAMQEIIEPRR